jgi:hypothetical protein
MRAGAVEVLAPVVVAKKSKKDEDGTTGGRAGGSSGSGSGGGARERPTCVALYPYTANDAEELSFQQDDVIIIIEDKPEWLLVRVGRSTRECVCVCVCE